MSLRSSLIAIVALSLGAAPTAIAFTVSEAGSQIEYRGAGRGDHKLSFTGQIGLDFYSASGQLDLGAETSKFNSATALSATAHINFLPDASIPLGIYAGYWLSNAETGDRDVAFIGGEARHDFGETKAEGWLGMTSGDDVDGITYGFDLRSSNFDYMMDYGVTTSWLKPDDAKPFGDTGAVGSAMIYATYDLDVVDAFAGIGIQDDGRTRDSFLMIGAKIGISKDTTLWGARGPGKILTSF